MRDELLLYYERELNYLRQLGAEFAEKYPKIASRLVLDTEKESADPHVERLLEGFSFLAARVHLKIDDEFPEITEALLSILYPHYIRPIPSMSIVEMHLDVDQGGAASPQKVARGSILNSKPVGGVPCQFQTCFDTTVWPLRVTGGEWTSPDRLSPAVKNAEAAVGDSNFVRGAAGYAACGEWNWTLCGCILPRMQTSRIRFTNCCVPIRCRFWCATPRRTPGCGRWRCGRKICGRRDSTSEDPMLPYPRRSFPGYRLLQEYFTFPEKFFFFDVTGLREAWPLGFKNRFELVFLFSPFELSERRQILELGVSAKTFRINYDADRQFVFADCGADFAGPAQVRVSGDPGYPAAAGYGSVFGERSVERQPAVK